MLFVNLDNIFKTLRFSLCLVLLLFLFPFSKNAYASEITLTATFDSEIVVGEEVTATITLSGADKDYNLKIYASPSKNSRHSSYVETWNGNKYITSGWSNYPVISNGEHDIIFRLKKYDESTKIYLRAGINASTNIYSDWVGVNISENTVETEVLSESSTSEVSPKLEIEFDEDVYFNDVSTMKVTVEDSDKNYYVKVLGSIDKKGYGYIKTVNDEKYLAWNSPWDEFPEIKGNKEYEIGFFIDANIDELFLKVRAKEVDSAEYIDSGYGEVNIKVPSVLGNTSDNEEEVDSKDTELNVKEEKATPYYLDSNGFDYKKVAINLRPKSSLPYVRVVAESDNFFLESDSGGSDDMVGFSLWNLFQKVLKIVKI